jgi:hypothetical protein
MKNNFYVKVRKWLRVDELPILGCWFYKGKLNHDGYARARYDGKSRYLHRVTYEHLNGKIPFGLELDHLCKIRHCISPYHVEPVTHAENVKRGDSVKSTCIRGHDLAINEYLTKDGRRCRICKNIANILYRKRKKENKWKTM